SSAQKMTIIVFLASFLLIGRFLANAVDKLCIAAGMRLFIAC
ncbi:hypothetical protein HMPREF1586_00919, partial [Gardnerella vaginalis JCP8522]